MKLRLKKFLKKIREKVKNLLMIVSPTYRATKYLYPEVQKVFTELRKELRLLDRKYELLYWNMMNDGDLADVEKKKKFFMNFECTSPELRIRQLKYADMLRTFKQICEENGLTYWLEGGTLLGAVRHDGFIPWDDDLDVNMPIDDMCKLKELLSDNNTYEFRNKYNYYLGCIVPGVTLRDNPSFWIDVFPMKLMDSSALGLKETENVINRYSREMRAFLKRNLPKPHDAPDEFINMDNKNDKNVAFITRTMEKYEKMLPEVNVADSCYRALSAHNAPGGCDLFYLDDIFPLTEAEFEGEMYKIPKEYNKWLTTYYGDYFHIPLTRLPKHM